MPQAETKKSTGYHHRVIDIGSIITFLAVISGSDYSSVFSRIAEHAKHAHPELTYSHADALEDCRFQWAVWRSLRTLYAPLLAPT